ncbi:MAG: NUDIX hydrolase [Actinomycetota bacterium]|nr:NUDIX hydrolase [Actinomycetota bacterium]
MTDETAPEVLQADDPRLGDPGDLALALAQVAAVTSDDAEVVEARDRILAFGRAHDDALWRSCTDAHLTASCLVVAPDRRRVAVLHHRKLGRWLQPGGHADGQGNLAAAALREGTEETGIDGLAVVVPAVDIDIHRVAPPGEEPHLHLDVRFVLLAPAGAELVGNHESTALRWIEPDALDDIDADRGLRRLVTAGSAVVARLAG